MIQTINVPLVFYRNSTNEPQTKGLQTKRLSCGEIYDHSNIRCKWWLACSVVDVNPELKKLSGNAGILDALHI